MIKKTIYCFLNFEFKIIFEGLIATLGGAIFKIKSKIIKLD